jgi:hypothetical protein
MLGINFLNIGNPIFENAVLIFENDAAVERCSPRPKGRKGRGGPPTY